MVASIWLTLALVGAVQQPSPPEVVAQISVHGNQLTPDAEVVQLSGVRVGAPFDPSMLESVASVLRATHRFESVEVLKRFASIADPTQIILVILVDDGRVRVNWDTGEVKAAKAFGRRHGPHLMFLPILDAEDGYGFSYGVQLAVPNPIGRRSRLSFPLTWGGERRAGVELEKYFDRGPFTRIEGGSSLSRRENPFFNENDDRRRVWIRGQREIARVLRAGVTAGWDHASFFETADTFASVGADIEFDTRIDPMLARNAVYVRAARDHLSFGDKTTPGVSVRADPGSANRTTIDGRGYIGLVGQSVIVLRGLREDSDRPLPPYLKPLLGGMANLRGFEAGSAVGDTLVSASAEVLVPLTSPLSIGKLGVSAFVDAATVYNKGERFRDQDLDRGFGGSVWFSAAVVRLKLAVAHGMGGTTRVHFGTTVTF